MQDIDMSQLNNCRQQSNHIWGVPAGILGEAWYAKTDAGNEVVVWVPHNTNSLPHSYFCHGWSLGTYQIHGYTVFSGPSLRRVLHDEWTPMEQPAIGDICVWYGDGGAGHREPLHSATIEQLGGKGGHTQMYSKNGSALLGGLQTYTQVNEVYKAHPHYCDRIRFFRRTNPLPEILPVLPE